MPDNPAERVVAGAIALAPNLGEGMISARLLSRPVVLRELAPQDLKIEVEQFLRKQRQAWRDQLTRKHDKKMNAPSWLWRSIVILAGQHEAGYLEHCRRFATAA